VAGGSSGAIDPGDPGDPGGPADAVVASARAGEPDRYLAALLAPTPARAGLLALAALSGELARVPLAVTREPAMGDIRLQWWRDALADGAPATRTGHPVADAVRDAIARHALPRALIDGLIDVREFDLSGAPMPDDATLASYLWKSEGAAFALAARVTGVAPGAGLQAVATAAGEAYGLVRLLLGLPQALSRGRLQLPQTRIAAAGATAHDLLSGTGGEATAALLAGLRADARTQLRAARQHVADLPRTQRTAFLPLALVEPYLRTLERPGRHPLREAVELVPFARVVRIAAAHWLGRI